MAIKPSKGRLRDWKNYVLNSKFIDKTHLQTLNPLEKINLVLKSVKKFIL
jgi:hypothetical protein